MKTFDVCLNKTIVTEDLWQIVREALRDSNVEFIESNPTIVNGLVQKVFCYFDMDGRMAQEIARLTNGGYTKDGVKVA